MKRTLHRRLFTLIAALVVATASVVSAALMVPDTPFAPDSAVFQVAGVTVADLCGDAPSAHDHRCPFCNIQTNPPAPALSCEAERLFFTLSWRTLSDLSGAALHGNPHVSARAPPAQA